MLVVFNTETGTEVTRMPAAGESDDVFFDASRKRIYEIGGEGAISAVPLMPLVVKKGSKTC